MRDDIVLCDFDLNKSVWPERTPIVGISYVSKFQTC